MSTFNSSLLLVCSLTAEEYLQIAMFGSCLTYSCARLHVVITSNTLVCMYIYTLSITDAHHTHALHTPHIVTGSMSMYCASFVSCTYKYYMHIQFYALGNCLPAMANLPATPLSRFTQQIVMRVLWRGGTKTRWSHCKET